jgi:hypothetical protein
MKNTAHQFDGVLENASQEAVYSAAASDAADAVLAGFNATVFAYGQVGRDGGGLAWGRVFVVPLGRRACKGVTAVGTASDKQGGERSCRACTLVHFQQAQPRPPARQTGAGKTFSMCGDARNYHHRGVIPRALHHIFREIDLRPDRIYR